MVSAVVDDTLICEAYIWALDKYRNEHKARGFRLLTDEDFDTIYQLRGQLGREWRVESHQKFNGWPTNWL